ncbi:MAG: hypothetical protein CSA33_06325 [Desulfobulbus propionicus]|nr:MAG: hypothetical protein CSA33_06325 [Desulfobulbus propionicus]
MEKLVAELKRKLPLKDTTIPGDIVIVASREPEFVSYAVITDIIRDDTRKHEWWHVTMLLLGIPPQKVTWTLRTPQYTGREIFTMGGHGRFIQALEFEGGKGRNNRDKKERSHKCFSKNAGLRIVKE